MPGKRFLAIVNPHGGRKRGMAVAEQVQPVFDNANDQLDLHPTEYAGHATDLARSFDRAEYDAICVIGGDGTNHEVVKGLMQRDDDVSVPLGLIPAGTGNTLHQDFGCRTPLEAAQRITAGEAHALDVIRVTTANAVDHCINIVGWGAVADINHRAERLRMIGRPRYAASALIQIIAPKVRPAIVELDGKRIEDEFLFILACNTRNTGAGMLVAPNAKVDDGLIDVVLLRNTSRFQALRLFSKVFDGSHLSLPCVECRQIRSLKIETTEPHALDMDGEMKGSSPFAAEVLPGALSVLC